MAEDISRQSVLLQIALRQQGLSSYKKLQKSAKNSLAFTQRLKLEKELIVHKGCVNSIVWNETGDKILSGSDDQKLVITNPFNSKVFYRFTTVHRSNIFSAKFLPNGDNRIISCAGNGSVIYTDLENTQFERESEESETLVGGNYRAPTEQANYFNCHTGTAYEVINIPTESNCFLSCGEDGTVRFFDLRQVSKCTLSCCRENILVYAPSSVSSMSLSPISNHYLAVGCSDFVRIVDRRYLKLIEFPQYNADGAPTSALSGFDGKYYTEAVKLFKIPLEEKRPYRVTSLVFSPNEQELLVSFSSEYLYLFNLNDEGVSPEGNTVAKGRRRRRDSPKVLRKLRLRGDWSDTGPEARPLSEVSAQSRPQLNLTLMNRMTGLLSRMLNDPRQRTQNRGDENNFDRVAEGISALFCNDANIPAGDDGASTSAVAGGSSSSNDEAAANVGTSNSSSSGSDDDTTINKPKFNYVKQKFLGHRNARTMIKEANFWGDDFILSGSDCGHCFIWNRHNGELVNLLQADRHVVNCVQPHQSLPILATSGIDYNVKIWTPSEEENVYDEKQASDIMQRNRLMLEETRDVVTVPASFMIRMLACLHSYNRNNNNNSNSNDDGNVSTNNDNENNENNDEESSS